MRRTLLWTLALLVAVSTARAQEESKDEPKQEKPATPAEEFQAVLKEYSQARIEFSRLIRKAAPEDRQKLFEEKLPRPEKYALRFLEIAEKNPDDPVAVDVLAWVATNVSGEDVAKIAVDSLVAKLRKVLEKSPHEEVQAHACFSLAKMLSNSGSEESAKESEELFERVIEKYAEVKSRRGTLADAAKILLFEIRHLGIGKVAPEIEGEDIDGVAFKLSDYRGKVVVLDFWGNW